MNRFCRTIISLFVISISAYGMGNWQEQHDWAEGQTAEYLSKYPQVRSDSFVFKTIELSNGQPLELDMRIERPRTGGPFPVVFFVHGGGWITGSKAHFCHQSFELANNGIAGVRIEYRWMSHGGVYSNVMKDVLDAVDYVRQRKDKLNIDFKRVGLSGGSAGGHLSAVAAQLTPECICYDGFNGLYDIINPDTSRFGGREDFVGSTNVEKKRASAIYQIKVNPPDTFLYHGTEDVIIDIQQSSRFANAIKKMEGQACVLSYEGVGHGFFMQEPYLTQTTQALLDHTRNVFGLTDERPQLSRYAVLPKIASVPTAFTIIGKWIQKDQPDRILEFKPNRQMIYDRQKVSWDERYGNYYIIWKDGTRSRIDVLESKKIKVSDAVYTCDSTNIAVVPTKPDLSMDWLAARYEEVNAELEKSDELSKVDVVFVGDSITQGWLCEGWTLSNESFSGQPWKVLNLGVAGDRTEHVLYRLQSKSDGGVGNLDNPVIRPRVIVLMIGTNNLFSHEPEQIVAGVLACKTRLQELEPQARIVLCSVLPVHKDQMNRDIVIPVNTALEKMQMPPTVSWLDLYSKFVNEDGSQNTVLYNDEVHLNEAGYQVWYDSLIQLLENLTK